MPLTAAAGLELSPFVCFLPFVAAEEVAEASWMSSRTRRSKAGKVRTSPDRRRVRAWDWIAVGQSAPLELRLWRRRSWILTKVSECEWRRRTAGGEVGKECIRGERAYFVT